VLEDFRGNADWRGALFGAVVGALLTAVIAYGAYRWERRRVELAALRRLMRELSERRAFREAREVRVFGARWRGDYRRANQSIVDARNSIRDTRSLLIGRKSDQQTLTRMIQACNDYLESSEESADLYYSHLARLRERLYELLHQTGLRHGKLLVPGSEAHLERR
jgi:hypothetical protein